MRYPSRIATTRRSGSTAALRNAARAGLLPSFPFGSDFTEVEQRLMPALEALRDASRSPLALIGLLMEGFRPAMRRCSLRSCAWGWIIRIRFQTGSIVRWSTVR